MKNYQAVAPPDPIWTRVAYEPEDALEQTSYNSNFENGSSVERQPILTEKTKGLTTFTAAVFIAGEMAGSGVLALPRAIVDSGGLIGLVLLVIFCINAGFGGTCLGYCWEILEERFPEHRTRTRNPYATIAYRAVGKWGSVLVSSSITFTLFGAGTVYLLLSSQIFQELLEKVFPRVSFCFWFLVIAAFLTPFMWLGSPKDFSAVGLCATLTTAVACILMFLQILTDGSNLQNVKHRVHGFEDFFLAFGTLLFAFGGASTFPTIQNDMENKKNFPKSIGMAFSVILILYLPVSAAGYYVYGEDVQTNVAMSLSKSYLVIFANILMAMHLILAFLIVINPVCQELEEIFGVPHHYHWKRCVLRTLMVLIMVFIGESIPHFGKILSLVGGSTITLLTFILPPFFYMRLCQQKSSLWPKRSIPFYFKVYLWELIAIGVIGGSAATYSAIRSIFGSGMTKPCYYH